MSGHKRVRLGLWLSALLLATSLFSEDLDGKIITEIRFDGLDYTKPYVVERELHSHVGELFSEQTLRQDTERLDRLRLFSSIDARAVDTDAGVRIEITLHETFPYMPTISIQVNDENGASAGPGFKSVNFLGRGIELNAAAQFGGSTNLDFSVTNPWFAGNHLSYHARYLHRDRPNELDQFHEIANDVQLRLGSFIGGPGRVGARGAFQTIESDRDGVTLSPDNQDVIATLGVFVGYDSRDIWSRPHRGWWSEIDIVHNNVVDTRGAFWTTNIDVRRYDTWKQRNTLLLTSLTTLQSGVLGVDIPIYEDFHIGGTNTIRGWPLDAQSGKNQFINTVEYRFLLREPRPFSVSFFTGYIGLQLAAFGDFGQAWNEADAFGLDEFIDGYGVGLRVLIPFVDEVRLDVAWGNPGEGLTFHFGIYPKAVMQRQRVR
jgi:outer membrane protein assembly factor BamA